jgi:hypothetical protein
MSEDDERGPRDVGLGGVGWILLVPVVVALVLRLVGG